MTAPDDRRPTRRDAPTDGEPMAWLFAALLVGPLVAYWAVRLLRRGLTAARRALVGSTDE